MNKFLLAFTFFAGTTCYGQDENYVTGLSGAYLLLSQSLEASSGDTTYTERKQLKIYTDYRYMMYVRLSPEDSASSFGIGTFSIKKGKLTEHIIYSALDSIENTNSFSGTVNISKRLKGYEQVIPEILSERGKVRLTEDYQLLPAGVKSPLDGTWKLAAAYTVNSNDTIQINAVKYKTYYKGNFTSGSFIARLPGEKKTIAEYGTFRITEKNKLKENITYSTRSERNAGSYDLDITMKGNDVLTAIFSTDTGIQQVERYTRMK